MADSQRLGLVTRQASANAVHILIGTIAGAVNTIVVLPAAFAQDERSWGLLITLTSWAIVLAQLLSLGSSNTLIRFLPMFNDSRQKQRQVQGFAFGATGIGLAVFGVFLLCFADTFLGWFQEADREILKGRLVLLYVLFASISLNIALGGYLSARLKSTWMVLVQESWLKGAYLLVAFAFYMTWVSFEGLLVAYAATYVVATLLLLGMALRSGLGLSFGRRGIGIRSLVSYALFSVLDRGISLVVHRTDLVMLGLILGIDPVAGYSLAYYIGAVSQIPQKAISAIANPLMSKAIEAEDRNEMQVLYSKSALNQLLLGGMVFTAVWASIRDIMALLPAKFQGGENIVLFVGLSKLMYLASGSAGALVQFSRHYRTNFVLNLGYFLLTVLTNYLAMSPQWLNWGVEGAAVATAVSGCVYNAAKIGFVRLRFGIHPFQRNWWYSALLISSISLALYAWSPTGIPLANVLMKGILVVGTMGGIAYWGEWSPEGNALVNKVLRRP